jgi:hypothetical protein
VIVTCTVGGAQQSRFYLKTETDSSLRNVVFNKKQDDWILPRKFVVVLIHRHHKSSDLTVSCWSLYLSQYCRDFTIEEVPAEVAVEFLTFPTEISLWNIRRGTSGQSKGHIWSMAVVCVLEGGTAEELCAVLPVAKQVRREFLVSCSVARAWYVEVPRAVNYPPVSTEAEEDPCISTIFSALLVQQR